MGRQSGTPRRVVSGLHLGDPSSAQVRPSDRFVPQPVPPRVEVTADLSV